MVVFQESSQIEDESIQELFELCMSSESYELVETAATLALEKNYGRVFALLSTKPEKRLVRCRVQGGKTMVRKAYNSVAYKENKNFGDF